jgi:hypothetical protein
MSKQHDNWWSKRREDYFGCTKEELLNSLRRNFSAPEYIEDTQTQPPKTTTRHTKPKNPKAAKFNP